MTIDEAIQDLMYNVPSDEAIDMAITALNEKKERESNNPLSLDELKSMIGHVVFICPYNDYVKVVSYGLIFFGTSEPTLWEDVCDTYNNKWFAYKYQPVTTNEASV